MSLPLPSFTVSPPLSLKCKDGQESWRIDLFRNSRLLIYSFICLIISLSDLVIMCKIQKNSYFQTRSERLSIIHIERFHSRDQHLCKFIETKKSVYIRKEFNSHRTGLGHQHGAIEKLHFRQVDLTILFFLLFFSESSAGEF